MAKSVLYDAAQQPQRRKQETIQRPQKRKGIREMENFSSALKLTNLDDFIAPSQNCVKPEIISKKSDKRAKIEVRGDGTYLEIMDDGKHEVLETAKISLNDCLACRFSLILSYLIVVVALPQLNQF
jgi:hypothetical protein